MARQRVPVCRLCRAEGQKLYLKGSRCATEKCAVTRRAGRPGVHPADQRRKPSDYAMRLREKQKVRRLYGVLERQFRGYVHRAERGKGVTGVLLLQMLERRLDNVLYRLGFAVSRAQGRQLVFHGAVTVNGRRVDIPSFLVGPSQVVQIKVGEAVAGRIREGFAQPAVPPVPPWIERQDADLKGIVKRLPSREDVQFPIDEQLIVELYSR